MLLVIYVWWKVDGWPDHSVILIAVTSTVPPFIVFFGHCLQTIAKRFSLVNAHHVHAAHNLLDRPHLISDCCARSEPRMDRKLLCNRCGANVKSRRGEAIEKREQQPRGKPAQGK